MRGTWLLLALVAAAGIAALLWNRAASSQERTVQGALAETRERHAQDTVGTGEASSGEVLDDEAGEPVPRARVTAYRISFDLPAAEVVATAVADDRGTFSLVLRGEDAARLVIEAEGYPPQSFSLEEATEVRLVRGEQTTLRIVDEEGRPVEGAVVDVFADFGMRLQLAHAEADAGGVATLRLAGDETLLVWFPGHAYESVHRYGRGEWPTEVTLVPEYTIGGRIVDSAGQPIPGASVRLRQGTDCGTESVYGPTALAGRDGGFLFRGVHECACELNVRADGYAEKCVRAAPGDERMRIVMRHAATASGVVVMADGSPAPGASVRLDWLAESRGAKADAEGRFELTGLEPRAQAIFASAEGGPSAQIEIAPKEGEAITGLRLELGAPSKAISSFVRLQVVDERGRAVPGATVAAHNGRGSTDRDGVLALDTGARPGLRTTIAIRPPAEEPQRLIGTVVPAITWPRLGEAPVLDVVLHDGVFVRVEAREPDGSPLADASVELYRDGIESGQDVGNPAAREHDWYVDPHDTYLVRVRAKGFILFKLPGWSPSGTDGVLVTTLRPCAAVKGCVRDSRGIPPGEIHATVDFHLDHMGMGRRLTCGPDGSFLIEGLEEGTGMLTFGLGRGEPEAGVEVRTRSGQTTDVGNLTLVPPAVLTGRVVDSTGRPLGGARVTLETGLPDSYVATYSRADGNFRVIVPGFAQGGLLVRKGGFGTVRLPLAGETGRTLGDITMPTPGTLEVDVEGVDWMVTEYFTIEVMWQTARESPADEDTYRQLDPRPYRIDLAPGRYLARLTVGDVTLQDEVQIAEGETAKIAFRLR